MSCPLYKGANVPSTLPTGAHAGLWFDKFFDRWQSVPAGTSGKLARESAGKIGWIKTLTSNIPGSAGATRKVGDKRLLEEVADRVRALASARTGTCCELISGSRIALGMGNPNPIENGLRFHPSLGAPFIPATALKGVARAWASLLPLHEADINRIFGPRSGALAAGTAIFLDALPSGPVALEADVMTPHFSAYYEDARPPADWCEPNPIPFLTVAAQERFLFAVLPRRPERDTDDARMAFDWLMNALAEMGIGGKTSLGYGRFGPLLSNAGAESDVSVRKAARYKAGDLVTAKRVEDPKGKGRSWFEADDGVGGVVASREVPAIEPGESVQLEVTGVSDPPSYNFRIPRSSPSERGSRPDNRPGDGRKHR